MRGFDIANITIVEGDSGLIVTDATLTTAEVGARRRWICTIQHRPRQAGAWRVIYTHSHADHFGGARRS
ncbi:MAG: MBL fold metallo-hydrolase [Rhodopseudomonas palustris]|nr:MBL fold metallo-hydrolase [Rhodopseudomonas palustris]